MGDRVKEGDRKRMERERDTLPKQQWEESKLYYTLSFWDLQLYNDASSLSSSQYAITLSSFLSHTLFSISSLC